jgi:hypothetical protein
VIEDQYSTSQNVPIGHFPYSRDIDRSVHPERIRSITDAVRAPVHTALPDVIGIFAGHHRVFGPMA